MSAGKGGAPVACIPAAAIAIPLVVAGLAAVGVAKGVQAGYRFVKKTREESKKTADEVWLSQMKKAPMDIISISSTDTETPLQSLKVEGIKLDNVFSHLSSMSIGKTYNSGLSVTDYSVADRGDRAVVIGLAGKDKRIAFAKDDKGNYMAFGNISSSNELSKEVYNVINTFYINELNYRLSNEWGFTKIDTHQTPDLYKFTATDKDKQTMTVEINLKNGQPGFEGVPERLRPEIEKWLERFSECRITRSGDAGGIKIGGRKRGRVSG